MAPSNGLTVTRNAGARFFLTSEDEWYKAAYDDATSMSYNLFPFADGSPLPLCEVPPGTTSRSANCARAVDTLTDVGAYTGSPSEYGTFDQGGNVAEWNEAIISGSRRGQRGGTFSGCAGSNSASTRANLPPSFRFSGGGFRVASLPEPGTGLLVACGLVGLAWTRRRRLD